MPADFMAALEARRRYDEVFKVIGSFRVAPRPGWKVLLKPGNLLAWAEWARRYEQMRAQGKDNVLADNDGEFVDAWRWDALSEFFGHYGAM